MKINHYFLFKLDSSMSSAMVTNNNRNVKNPMLNGYFLSINWEPITIFEFKSTWTANRKWYLINNKGINILIFQMTLENHPVAVYLNLIPLKWRCVRPSMCSFLGDFYAHRRIEKSSNLKLCKHFTNSLILFLYQRQIRRNLIFKAF